MNPYKLIKYQLYLLQLENYELGRYFKLLFKKGFWPKGEQRKVLAWTGKARLIFLMAILMHLLASILLWCWIPAFAEMTVEIFLLLVIFCLLFFCYFIFYSLSLVLLWPFDWMAKNIIITRAKSRIRSLPNLKIIGIAGSYGKTTMKEILTQVLSSKHQVAGTPESVNTPVGIARWILDKVDGGADIAILEMGEHYVGDVEYLCRLTPPDIAVVTGINEAHLERMKSLSNITSTIFEVVSKAKPGALVVLNGDDENIVKHYKEYVWPDHKLEFFSKNSNSEKCKVKSAKFNTEELLWEAEVEGIGRVDINLLGEYALGDVDAAIKIARELKMNDAEIKIGINRITSVEHRLQPIKSAGDVLVIDDSYNGNPAGAAEAVKVLSRFVNNRKIYITPGLVEMGEKSASIHRIIGEQLAGAADVVILIKNSVTPWIEQGIKSANQRISKSENQVIWFDSAQEAHAELKNILKPGDVILFQNDWGDQYI